MLWRESAGQCQATEGEQVRLGTWGRLSGAVTLGGTLGEEPGGAGAAEGRQGPGRQKANSPRMCQNSWGEGESLTRRTWRP